ncbi:MAG TPA: NADH-quinone oxidoreductase subunit L [Gemmataceae bacterium]|jgi:NADH-quinone oxidoreductase subunit L|nr:NADH-quinone oxidoreductase subunit L [Gemmataceae bacterium]
MVSWLLATPGRLYVLATLLPLAAFTALLIAGCLRNLCRPYRDVNGLARFFFYFLGGNKPLRSGAYLATGAIALSAVLGISSLVRFLNEAETSQPEDRWSEHATWAQVGLSDSGQQAIKLEIGYRIDHLTAIMFAMVAFVSTCIFVFSLGYMKDETEEVHEDHEVHVKRPGRYGRFFLFLSLFCFSMLNLLIADNLFQVFISWELVGVCSFFLIGFYHERRSAGLAANKAFIVNRIGDAGFMIGLALVWTYFGTFNFQAIFAELADKGPPMSHQLFVIAGIGIFLGCVGKSAQFPLHTWLPDAMEGPTPVSALIHAATMVAAGVYLVGRCFPIFTPEVRLVIAYTGGLTLFLAATIALVQTDIKRVLAYSTVSQLGFMMLALGVGGWVAGLLHLLTHAFFKALLFLGSGSVILGCHHEQDLTKMGGLRRKMPITAATMLVGVLAIAGTPFFSGWYSKDLILSNAMGFGLAHKEHIALFVLPLVTAGMTAFYMFRLWFLAFAGSPRDHASEHVHESPWVMTLPLIVLAILSICVAWGWPLWEPHESYVGHLLEKSRPAMASDLAVEDHLAGWLALVAAAAGVGVAVLMYGTRKIDAAAVRAKAGALYGFLLAKWHFDELYDALFVGPAVALGYGTARFDKRAVPADQAEVADRTVNLSSLDGVLNALGLGTLSFGRSLRGTQSGLIRRYVTVLLLTAVALVGVLVVIYAGS